MIVISSLFFIIGLWAFLLFFSNKKYLQNLQKGWQAYKSDELITVAVPARNEEACIERCIRSLLKQSHTNLQILILDDASTDATRSIAQRIAQEDDRITVLQGKQLQQGYRGKIFAMQQLLEASKGSYILFTDADTIHTENSVAYGLAMLKKTKASLVSGYPKQLTPSLPVELIVSAMLFNPVLFVPFKLQEKLQARLFAMAIGQYLMIKTDALVEAGGFDSIKSETCDDVALARMFAQKGYGQVFAPMQEFLSCEMFTSFSSGWHSLERSINAVVKQNFLGLLLILCIVCILILLSCSPFFTLFILSQLFFKEGFLLVFVLSLGGNILLFTAWMRATSYFKFSKQSGYFVHLTICFIVLMYLHGLYLHLSGKGFVWKGRNVL